MVMALLGYIGFRELRRHDQKKQLELRKAEAERASEAVQEILRDLDKRMGALVEDRP